MPHGNQSTRKYVTCDIRDGLQIWADYFKVANFQIAPVSDARWPHLVSLSKNGLPLMVISPHTKFEIDQLWRSQVIIREPF